MGITSDFTWNWFCAGHCINVKDADGRWVSTLEGVDAIAGPLIDVFFVPDGKDTIGVLDRFLQVDSIPVVVSVVYSSSNCAD